LLDLITTKTKCNNSWFSHLVLTNFYLFILFASQLLGDILKPKVYFFFMKMQKESSMICMKDFFWIIIFEKKKKNLTYLNFQHRCYLGD
jgi:hypothetical protein